MPQSRHDHGFTMIELVAVIIIVGILAVFTIPQFVGTRAFNARGAYDDLAATLRYAQKVAIAGQCHTVVVIDSAHHYKALQAGNANCTGALQPITRPGASTPLEATVADSVTLSPTGAVAFYADGHADKKHSITVGSRTITVHAATGFVEAP